MSKPVSEYLTATRQFFGDGEYWLHLPLRQAVEFERPERGRTISSIYGQLLDGFVEMEGGKIKLLGTSAVSASVINEVVRLGLIGGDSGPEDADGDTGVGPKRAESLVKLYGYPSRPIEEVGAVAFRLLHAAIYGDPTQREALPEQAAESDAANQAISKQAGELFRPKRRAKAERPVSAE